MSAMESTIRDSIARTKSNIPMACALCATIAGTAFGAPVLITAPKTIGPLDTTITPTGGGAAVALSDAEITVTGTTLTINGLHTISSLSLQNSAVLQHSTNTTFDYPGTGIVRGMSLTVLGNATIDGSKIDVSGRGYPNASGPGAGIPKPGCGGVGGGHGGVGGQGHCGPGQPGGISYGSATEPTEFGSGGGHFPGFGLGGYGGGCVRLIVGGTLQFVGGSILADGLSALNAGGGAGGSIWIKASAITGAGTIRAKGGDQGTTNNSGGGGGGGRVSVSACSSFGSVAISVPGGSGAAPGQPGGIGSISSTSNSAPAFQSQPESGFSCPTGEETFSAIATGTDPIAYHWQIESAPKDSNVWTDLSDGPVMFDGVEVGTGAGAGTKDFSFQNNPTNRASFRLRCSVANECGTLITNPATYSVCTSDFTCDGGVDDSDFSIFVFGYNILDCADPAMPTNCPADVNGDGFVDDHDFSLFAAAYNLLLCE